MPRQLSVRIVGADYSNKDKSNRRFEIALCTPGEPIELVPEPKNPADGSAIAVIGLRGTQLGYIAANRAPWIGGLMRGGHDVIAIFQDMAPWGAWARIGIDCAPTLPPPTVKPDPPDDSGFHPDPVYPDDWDI